MKKSEMNSLEKGMQIQHKRNGQVLTVVAVQEDKIVCEEKTISVSNCTRWFDVVEIPEVVEPDNTVINDIEQAEDLTQEQDTQVVEPTITSDNTVHESSYTYAKNLDFKYLGEIILINHKFSMLENVYTNEIIFCTVDINAIIISGFGYGGIPLNNGHELFNLVRSEAELNNEVRVLTVKKDFINRFQGKNLKVKIRRAFKELDDDHNIEYINKNCPIDVLPKSFWTDVVLPLKEGKDILPKLYFHQNTIENPTAFIGVERVDPNNENIVKIHILDVDPKVLPTELVSKLRAWGFKDSYMTEGYLININMEQLGDDFIPIFNEVANIVGLNPITDQQQNTQQQEQQEDTTATTTTNTAVNEIQGEQDTTAINGAEILANSISGVVLAQGCYLKRMKQYIAVRSNNVKGTLVYIRIAKEGGWHFDVSKTTWNKLDTDTQVDLVEQFDACIKDKTRGLWRISNCDSLDIFEKLLTTALDIA